MEKDPTSLPAATAGFESVNIIPGYAYLTCNTSQGIVWDLDRNATDRHVNEVYILWLILYSVIIAGNLVVIVWRCSRNRDQRNSIPSMLVINLAAADLLLGVQSLIFLLLYTDWLCFAWLSPNYTTLMTSLCYISGLTETGSILVSSMLTATIAFYYATAVFGRCCCGGRFSRTCFIFVLCTEWIIAAAAAVAAKEISADFYTKLYTVKTQDVYLASNANDQLIPNNSTLSVIFLQSCIPISNALLILLPGNSIDVESETEGAVFGIMCILVLLAAGIYLAMVVKMVRLRASTTLTIRFGGLGFRLIAIAVISFLCWGAFIGLAFSSYSWLVRVLPFALIALCNPLTFTLTSTPFLKAMRQCKRIVFFKLGRPIPIEDVSIDSDSLIPTQAPPSDSLE